jgi:heme-degrading monooxygenase HmoA
VGTRSANGETETLPLLRHELWQSEATAMFSVIFEVHPRREKFDLYLELAMGLKPILEGIVGFIDNERFESTRRPGWILSHSTWRDEKSVVRWRTVAKHHDTQQRGRDEVFQDYHLRVGEIVGDTAPLAGASILEQRLDETEIGQAKFLTLTEIRHQSGVTVAALPDWLLLDRDQADLVDYDVFASIYNKGKLALLASWRDRPAAEQFKPPFRAGVDGLRHRVVRVVRDYGMFDRRESPQYYPAIGEEKTPPSKMRACRESRSHGGRSGASWPRSPAAPS